MIYNAKGPSLVSRGADFDFEFETNLADEQEEVQFGQQASRDADFDFEFETIKGDGIDRGAIRILNLNFKVIQSTSK